MFKEVKCLACRETLYRIGPLDEKGLTWGIYKEDDPKHESIRKWTDGQEYLECPHCKKKNWLASKKIEGLGLQVWISHVTE
ncbi:MAG: hypothetical protein NUV91_07260 [Candidatus Omnitrophica bacterium]|nr:hypothetical protein [Candidatus Omnitrophota bacterium]